MKSIVGLLGVLLVTGCAPTGPVQSEPPSICAGWKPIFLRGSTVDVLDDREVEAILGHNEFGRKNGCW